MRPSCLRWIPLLLILSGCPRDDAARPHLVPEPRPRAGGTAPPSAPTPPEPPLALDAEARAALEGALGSYETIRARLAGDAIEGVADAARVLADGLAAVKGEARPALDRAIDRARALAAAPSIEPARVAFAELSQALIDLLRRAPDLQTGRLVFRCPMATGYGKWIQTKAPLENPLFGSKMLTCGEASDWSE